MSTDDEYQRSLRVYEADPNEFNLSRLIRNYHRITTSLDKVSSFPPYSKLLEKYNETPENVDPKKSIEWGLILFKTQDSPMSIVKTM